MSSSYVKTKQIIIHLKLQTKGSQQQQKFALLHHAAASRSGWVWNLHRFKNSTVGNALYPILIEEKGLKNDLT